MSKLIIIACTLFMLAGFAAPAKAVDASAAVSGMFSTGKGSNILNFFGITGMSCGLSPSSLKPDCDDNVENGVFNSIACRVMQSFNENATPLYCNIIQNPIYLGTINALMVLYIIFMGFGFLTGIYEREFGVLAGQVLKVVIVYTFAVNADVYFAIVYNTVLSTPEAVVRIMLANVTSAGGTEMTGGGAGNSTPQNFFQYVDQGVYTVFSDVLKPAANELRGATAEKSTLKVIILGLALWQLGGDLVGGLFMFVVAGWLFTYLGIMVRYLLAQLALMFLLMLGPIFIPFFLFKRFEDIAYGWVKMMLTLMIQIMMVVGFVLMVQHFFVDFYSTLKNGMSTTNTMQESSTNRVVNYGNSYRVEKTPGYSNDDAAKMLGPDWKGKIPVLFPKLVVMAILVFFCSQFMAFVPAFANLVAGDPQGPAIMGGQEFSKRGKGVHLFGQKDTHVGTDRDILYPALVR